MMPKTIFRGLAVCVLALPFLYFWPDHAHCKAKDERLRIAIFSEKGFPASGGRPKACSSRWLQKSLSADFEVALLDSGQLSDKQLLNTDNFDLLILPYGENFPLAAFENISEYLCSGGGLFSVYAKPFWSPMIKQSGRWQVAKQEDARDKFLSQLGIKHYEGSDGSSRLVVATSLRSSPVIPTRGNVFPYRLPCRDFYAQSELIGVPGMGGHAVFVKSWRNPYRGNDKSIPRKWCFLAGAAGQHPFKEAARAAQELKSIMRFLSFAGVIFELQPDKAAYLESEKVLISVKAANCARRPEALGLTFEIFDGENRSVHLQKNELLLGPLERRQLTIEWTPPEGESGFYRIKTWLVKGGEILDIEENGFLLLDKGALKSGPTVEVKAGKFFVDGTPSLLLGINYYESRSGELMWVKPNLLRVREDFRKMRRMGLNIVRIHYHHPKWFGDYFRQVLNKEPDPYFDSVAQMPLPQEDSLRILDAVIWLAHEQGLIFCMDIFSLVPGEMGDPLGWLSMKERITDKRKVFFQKKFIRLLAKRYKDSPGIVWDLWNEPRLDEKDLCLLKGWAKAMIRELRRNNDRHPVTIGDDSSIQMLDILDYGCLHTYEPGKFKDLDKYPKPVVFQEVWNPAGYGLAEEMRQAQELRKDFAGFLESGAAGFLPWQWTRQARLWDSASPAERWDDELGLCMRDDGSAKAASDEYSILVSTAQAGKAK